jgi:hypothetical protein
LHKFLVRQVGGTCVMAPGLAHSPGGPSKPLSV